MYKRACEFMRIVAFTKSAGPLGATRLLKACAKPFASLASYLFLRVILLSSYLPIFLEAKFLGTYVPRGPQIPFIFHGSPMFTPVLGLPKPSKCVLFIVILSFQARKIRHFAPPRAF